MTRSNMVTTIPFKPTKHINLTLYYKFVITKAAQHSSASAQIVLYLVRRFRFYVN
jgi:hypothetical protein